MDIHDRITEAISLYIERNSANQSRIHLSSNDYKELHREAGSTELGRSFLVGKYGSDMCYCNMPVSIHIGKDIKIT